MNKKTVSILICALNEEKNIGLLLSDLLVEQVGEGFVLSKIYVVSDGSVDRTEEIVIRQSADNDKIVLIKNDKRIGKIFSLEKAFKLIDDDIVVSLDADIRLREGVLSNVLKPFLTANPVLVGGNPIPEVGHSFIGWAEAASLFSFYLLEAIKKYQPESIYSSHGRILALQKNCIKI